MGFRNPARSATAVDTGAGVIPGVKVYSDHGNPGSGVVEWNAYTARARVLLTSSVTGSGGTGWSFTLDGGPALGMSIVAQAAGGYAPEVDVDLAGGKGIVQNGYLYPGITTVGLLGDVPGLGPGLAPWTDDVYSAVRYTISPDGFVFVSGLVNVTGTMTGAVCFHGGPYSPLHIAGKGFQHIIPGAVSETPRLFDVRADGIYLRGAVPAAGSWLAVHGWYPSALRTG